jgi:hypothetical protein
MSRRKVLVADLLCGAGGSSTGCARALRELGLEMELVCVNHWPIAIETHRKNHPEARHYCQDISAVRPHLVVPEGYLDLLMASPYLDSLAEDYLDSWRRLRDSPAFKAVVPRCEGPARSVQVIPWYRPVVQ